MKYFIFPLLVQRVNNETSTIKNNDCSGTQYGSDAFTALYFFVSTCRRAQQGRYAPYIIPLLWEYQTYTGEAAARIRIDLAFKGGNTIGSV